MQLLRTGNDTTCRVFIRATVLANPAAFIRRRWTAPAHRSWQNLPALRRRRVLEGYGRNWFGALLTAGLAGLSH